MLAGAGGTGSSGGRQRCLDAALWAAWRESKEDVRDLENMTGKEKRRDVGLLNW